MSGQTKPRVLHGISHFALGGAEQVALEIVRALQADFSFGVFAVRNQAPNDPQGAFLAREYAKVCEFADGGSRVPMRFGGMLTGAWGLLSAIRRFRPDALHLHTEIPESSFAVLRCLPGPHRRLPIVRTVHNSSIWFFNPPMGRWCERRLADAVCVPVSHAAREAIQVLRQQSAVHQLNAELPIIHNGIPRLTQRAPGAYQDPVRILFAGRFEHEKGADLLGKIVRTIKLAPNQSAHLTVAGEGALGPLLGETLHPAPAGWQIELRSAIPNLRESLHSYDMVWAPSRFEGHPLIALEALAARVPVIASQADGLSEALPADYPWRSPTGNAHAFAVGVTEALQATEQWPDVTARAATWMRQRFDHESMAQSYAQIYRRLAKRSAA